jgi:ubiquinone/menaquinone biosynthesis C-methylase UbiE
LFKYFIRRAIIHGRRGAVRPGGGVHAGRRMPGIRWTKEEGPRMSNNNVITHDVVASVAAPACHRVDTDWDRLTHADIIRLNTYDFMAYVGKRVINPGGIRGRDQILAIIRPKPGSRVLEIGGGSGHAACHIARRYGCHVTTIDVSARAVAEAQRRVAAEGLGGRVRCEVGDVNDLPFADGSFDYVVSQAVIMFVEQRRALAEVYRVLKRDGVFAGLEFCWKRSPPDHVRDSTYRICGCKTLDFHSLDGWVRRLHQASFARVQGVEHPFGLLSVSGFVRDEGVRNSLRIAGKVIRRRAALIRMSQIWRHFSRHKDYFSYVVFSGGKGALHDLV